MVAGFKFQNGSHSLGRADVTLKEIITLSMRSIGEHTWLLCAHPCKGDKEDNLPGCPTRRIYALEKENDNLYDSDLVGYKVARNH